MLKCNDLDISYTSIMIHRSLEKQKHINTRKFRQILERYGMDVSGRALEQSPLEASGRAIRMETICTEITREKEY